MLRTIIFFIAMTTSLIGCAQTSTGVFVNGVEVQADYLQLLEQYYQTKVQRGRYWYDPYCGLWGMEGGPALGVMLPNLQFGGPMKSDASNGKTGIFINGRQINATERVQWEQLVGRITPDRYLLDAYGNVMTESGVYQLNLLQVAAASQQAPAAGYNDQGAYHDGSGNTFYRNWYTDTGSGSSSDGFFYVIGEDFSYSSY
jgi:hypothetical protein